MIDMHSEEQASKGYWFYSLIPKAVAKFKRKVIPEGMMFDEIRKAGILILFDGSFFKKHVILFYGGQKFERNLVSPDIAQGLFKLIC